MASAAPSCRHQNLHFNLFICPPYFDLLLCYGDIPVTPIEKETHQWNAIRQNATYSAISVIKLDD